MRAEDRPDYAPYPSASPQSQAIFPWQSFDYKADPKAYMAAIANYVFAGVTPESGDPATSPLVAWSHVSPSPKLERPEHIHGLQLDPNKNLDAFGLSSDPCRQAWALTVLNEPGAATVRQSETAAGAANQQPGWGFAVNTVMARLVFVSPPDAGLPGMDGAPEWTMSLDAAPRPTEPGCPKPLDSTSSVTRVRYIGLEVAVRDARSTNGWVYGTAAYDNSMKDPVPWLRLKLRDFNWGPDDSGIETTISPSERVTGSDHDGQPL